MVGCTDAAVSKQFVTYKSSLSLHPLLPHQHQGDFMLYGG